MKWKAFLRFQTWNVSAVLGSFLFCELPFVKSHFVNKQIIGGGWDTEIVGWAPFILLFALTAAYYVWLSIRYKRSGIAVVDQPACFFLFACLVLGLADVFAYI